MATEESISMEAMDIQGGKITFAPDVIATIASLAANEVEGVDSLGGTVVEGITGMLRKIDDLTVRDLERGYDFSHVAGAVAQR